MIDAIPAIIVGGIEPLRVEVLDVCDKVSCNVVPCLIGVVGHGRSIDNRYEDEHGSCRDGVFLSVSRPGTVGSAASFPHPVFLCGDKRSEEPVNEGSHDDNPIAADSDIHCSHEQAAEIRGKFCELYLHFVSYNQEQEGKAQKHDFIGKEARHPFGNIFLGRFVVRHKEINIELDAVWVQEPGQNIGKKDLK